MNKEHNRIITNFKNKISSIIILYKKIKKEKDVLFKEKLSLLEDIENLKVENSEIQKKYEILKFAKDLSFMCEDTKKTKDKLGIIVREIDKCLALLNK